jgi:hypothetical protein
MVIISQFFAEGYNQYLFLPYTSVPDPNRLCGIGGGITFAPNPKGEFPAVVLCEGSFGDDGGNYLGGVNPIPYAIPGMPRQTVLYLMTDSLYLMHELFHYVPNGYKIRTRDDACKLLLFASHHCHPHPSSVVS